MKYLKIFFLAILFVACNNTTTTTNQPTPTDSVKTFQDTLIVNTIKDTSYQYANIDVVYKNLHENKKYKYIKIKHLDSALYYANINLHEVGANGGFSDKYFESKIRQEGWRISYSWCAFAVKTFMTMGGATYPKIEGGLAQSFITKSSISAKDVLLGQKQIYPGDIAIWKHGNTYKGHVGFVYSWKKQSGITVEGNTSSGSSGNQSNGDGEYIRSRTIEPRNYFRIVSFTHVKYK